MYLKVLHHAQHSYISNVTIFGPLYWPSLDLYTRTHERNYKIIYIPLEKENASFIHMYTTCKKMHKISENNVK